GQMRPHSPSTRSRPTIATTPDPRDPDTTPLVAALPQSPRPSPQSPSRSNALAMIALFTNLRPAYNQTGPACSRRPALGTRHRTDSLEHTPLPRPDCPLRCSHAAHITPTGGPIECEFTH